MKLNTAAAGALDVEKSVRLSHVPSPQAPACGRWRMADRRNHLPSAISHQREARRRHSETRVAGFLLALGFLALASAHTAQAGINAWTSNGPGGGCVTALAIDPTTPSTLYAGTDPLGLFCGSGTSSDSSAFKSTDAGNTWRALRRRLETGCPSARPCGVRAHRRKDAGRSPLAFRFRRRKPCLDETPHHGQRSRCLGLGGLGIFVGILRTWQP
jgi:hypothetical protein